MSAPVSRWFVRCIDCLAVSAVEEPPNTYDWKCGICAGPIESMGRVERDRLIHEHMAAICDDRCTSARGPICNCKCGGKHHGSRRVVRVIRDAGPVPTVTPSAGREQARINAADYRVARQAALALLDPLLSSRRNEFLPRAEYDKMRELQAALRSAHEARSHRTRMKLLRQIIGPITPIQKLATANDTAPKIAEPPFTLTLPKTASPPATGQGDLFA